MAAAAVACNTAAEEEAAVCSTAAAACNVAAPVAPGLADSAAPAAGACNAAAPEGPQAADSAPLGLALAADSVAAFRPAAARVELRAAAQRWAPTATAVLRRVAISSAAVPPADWALVQVQARAA